ncbi:MAG: hypothetical protein P8101_15970 [Candidatus Thiodiazotropha sp.]
MIQSRESNTEFTQITIGMRSVVMFMPYTLGLHKNEQCCQQ